DGSFGGLVPPANIASGPCGEIYLLDPRGPRLKGFDPCECRFNPVPCLLGAGTGGRTLVRPYGIVIRRAELFMADTDSRVVRVSRLRALRPRRFLRPPPPSLAQTWRPTGIAVDGSGRVFVTDPDNGGVHRFGPNGRWEAFLDGFGSVTFIAIDCRGRLHV